MTMKQEETIKQLMTEFKADHYCDLCSGVGDAECDNCGGVGMVPITPYEVELLLMKFAKLATPQINLDEVEKLNRHAKKSPTDDEILEYWERVGSNSCGVISTVRHFLNQI